MPEKIITKQGIDREIMARMIHGDCLRELAGLPERCIDLVLCDLPYGMTQNRWDTIIPFGRLWTELYRVCKVNTPIVLHAMQPFTTKLIDSNLKDFRYCWYWDKHMPTNHLNAKKMPLRRLEDIAVFYRKPPLYRPQFRGVQHARCKPEVEGSSNYGKQPNRQMTGVYTDYYPTDIILDFPKDTFSKAGHPTAKPVTLERYLIRTYTDAGMTVLDMTMGSGTTGVAAIAEGRNFIGIERDEYWYHIACERVDGTSILPTASENIKGQISIFEMEGQP